ncbi:hypothetical protein B0H17DRAFT_1333334 [Mycena rosella]|uniref:Uncharacterized protein n=1 Tax=Mycena rosella TaxID=1033263 RepID=A0AAD7GAD3_MYCRO|nr:hypothetical protein B0H17DRAFT_1333334 [Mycena rosella]
MLFLPPAPAPTFSLGFKGKGQRKRPFEEKKKAGKENVTAWGGAPPFDASLRCQPGSTQRDWLTPWRGRRHVRLVSEEKARKEEVTAWGPLVAAQYGIIDPNPTLETAETRATAFVTDPSTTVQWYAIDVDPCTGVESERDLLLIEPDGTAPIGQTVFRLGKINASPATREVGFRYSSGTAPGPRGLIAGQFNQPIFDFGFPELISFGSNEIPLEFEEIPFLAMGSGPLEYAISLVRDKVTQYEDTEGRAGDETPLAHGLAHEPYYDPHEPVSRPVSRQR